MDKEKEKAGAARKFDSRYDIVTNINGEEDIFYNNKPFDAESGFMIKRAGFTVATPDYIMVREKTINAFKSIYLLEYISDGLGYIETADGTARLPRGSACLVRRRTECVYYADRETPYSKYWMAMSGTVIAGLLEMYDIDAPVTIIPVDISEEFEKILAVLAHWIPAKQKEAYRQVIFYVMKIFFKMSTAAKNSDIEPNLSYVVRRMIDDSLESNMTVDQITEKLNYSKRHINRVFKDTFHLTPTQYKLNQKMEYACYLLASNKYTVQQISDMLGFCDVHYFMNVFRKTQRQTVTEYRNKAISANQTR